MVEGGHHLRKAPPPIFHIDSCVTYSVDVASTRLHKCYISNLYGYFWYNSSTENHHDANFVIIGGTEGYK